MTQKVRNPPFWLCLAADADPKTSSRSSSCSFAAARAFPQPEVNAWIPLDDDWVEADLLWRKRRLVIETDGHGTHGTR